LNSAADIVTLIRSLGLEQEVTDLLARPPSRGDVAHPAPLTTAEAAAYLRYKSTSAIRMLVKRGLRSRQERERARRRCGRLRWQGEGSPDAAQESERGPEKLALVQSTGKAARTAR